MTEINNIIKYVEALNQSLEDKLWFQEFFRLPIFNRNTVVYDYGCGNGNIIKALAPFYPDVEFIGIDSNPKMIKIANKENTLENVSFYDAGIPIREDKQKILIMSSVFHEIFTYDNFSEFYKDIIDRFKPDYIFFRDMALTESAYRFSNNADIERILIKYIKNRKQLNDFEKNFGCIYTQNNLIHFLLKYRFKENWDREVKENYFPILFEDIPSLFKDYNVIYKKHYILPFIKDKIMEDFQIELNDNTHCNYIFKRKNG